MKSEVKNLLIAWFIAICFVGAVIAVFNPHMQKEPIIFCICASLVYLIIYIIGIYIKQRKK